MIIKICLIFIKILYIEICYGYYHQTSMKLIKVPLPEGSLFGYSISYQHQIKSLIISAPSADKYGQIFAYDVPRDAFSKIDFNLTTGDNSSTGYLLGADVKGGDSFFTTCAPRYIKTVEDNRTGTFARCFVKSLYNPEQVQTIHEISQSDRKSYGPRLEQLMDSFGWSIDVTSKNDILISGPVMSKGRVIRYTNISEYPQLLTPPKSEANESFFNFGYSIVSGNFFSDDQNNLSYAISSPYGNRGVGQVHFYKETGDYEHSLIDDDSGLATLFGTSMSTAKLDGRRASLLVGAGTSVTSDNHGADVGAVHVFMANDKIMSLKRTIRGKEPGGRFGSTIINIGDLDSDHRDDIAIASPYENNGNGAVYIYTANNILSNDLEIKYAQKIQNIEFKSFGLSLAALKDYDENGCNELAVGAPYSNAVMILKCFSSITANVFTILPIFQTRKTTNKDNITVQTCLNVSYSDKPENIIANISIKVNIMHPSAKLQDSTNGLLSYIESLHRTKTLYCQDVLISTPLDKNNELYPIQLTVNAQLENDPRFSSTFDPDRVILSARSVLSDINTIWISDCNSTFCNPVLKTEIGSSMTSPYVIGSTNVENIIIRITNTGETAYNPCARVEISSARILQAPNCIREGSGTLLCEPRNPIRTNQAWDSGMISLETKSLTSKNKEISIVVYTHMRCDKNNNVTISKKLIDLKTDANNLVVLSEAIPGDIVNVSYVHLNTDFSHLYTIINNGVTNWKGIESLVALNSSLAKIRGPILILANGETKSCLLRTDANIVRCDVGEIRKNEKIYVMLNLRVPPGSDGKFNVNKNVSVATTFQLIHGSKIWLNRVDSTLVILPPPQLSIWIYLMAGFVAILVLLIIVIIFYQCGFLQRKNKVLLRDLKKDVRRQSMRRTMKLREDIRAHSPLVEDRTEPIEGEKND